MVLKQKVGNWGSKNRNSWELDNQGQGFVAAGNEESLDRSDLGPRGKENVDLNEEGGRRKANRSHTNLEGTHLPQDWKCQSGPTVPESGRRLNFQIHEKFCLRLGCIVNNAQRGAVYKKGSGSRRGTASSTCHSSPVTCAVSYCRPALCPHPPSLHISVHPAPSLRTGSLEEHLLF